MGKASALPATSRSASGPARPAVSTSNVSNKSSILKSAFAPSYLQLHLFASVIQSFDSQQLRIHDTASGRLRQDHSAPSGTTINSLDWGRYRTSYRDNGQSGNKKKRKRAQTSEDVVVAYGTSASDVCIYSPAENRILSTLTGAHERGVRDFKFSLEKNEGWSIGGDNKLVQWNLAKDQPVRSIPLLDTAVSILSSPSSHEPQILCASATPYSISPSEDFRTEFFDSFKGQVHSLQRSGKGTGHPSELFLAVDNDRYINVFDIAQRKLVRSLVAGSEVEKLDFFPLTPSSSSQEGQLLAVVTRDGTVELFSHPFKLPTVLNGDVKTKRKNMTRKADAQVRLTNSAKGPVPIFAASVQGPDLVIVSIDGGVEPTFQKIRWQDEGSGELLFDGVKEVLKARSASILNAAQMNGVKDMGKTHVDESRTVVVNGAGDLMSQDAAIEISSGDEDEDEEVNAESESEAERGLDKDGESSESSDVEMEEAEALAILKTRGEQGNENVEDIEEQEQEQEPSFGDLLALKHPDMIAVADSFAPEKSTIDTGKQLALPSGMSLGTVLTQALRTNDTNLLESCLHANDVGIVQNTIQRLDSTLASILLSRLAERLASRPGRYGHLLSWVQWTCIAHGGAIAGQPDVANKIRTLYKVLTQRSKSLDKLLLLKGKLDMLDAQLTLRKQVQARRGIDSRDRGEPGMIYIEGGEDNWSSDEDVDEVIGVAKKSKGKNQSRQALEDLVREEVTSEDSDDEDMPTMNGLASERLDEEDDSDVEVDKNGRTKREMYDLEAEVSGEGDSEDEEEDGDDVDESDEGEQDDDDEEDSSMDSFINDGEISYASEEDDTDLDDEPAVRKPEKKKSKHR